MLVSVIVPVYNVEKYLERCLDSLINQTFKDFEIICVNDCTKDNSQQILDYYKKKYPEQFILHKNKTNMGLGATREEGMKLASGQYIMFVDSDDYVRPDWIQTYYNAMVSGDYDIVAGGYTRDCGGKKHDLIPKPGKYTAILYPSAVVRMYKRSFIEKNHLNFHQLRRYEDNYWMIMQYVKHPKLCNIEYSGYYYYENNESITKSFDNSNLRMLNDMKNLFETIYRDIDLSSLTQDEKNIIEYVFVNITIIWLLLHNRHCGWKNMKERVPMYFGLLAEYFPNYMRNPFIGLFKLPEEQFKVRVTLWIIYTTRKLHLDNLVYFLLAI